MRKILQLVVVLSLAAVSGLAQDTLTTGRISGTVTDVNGAAILNASVTVSGPTLPQARTATTSDQGIFEITNLVPGNYNVKVEMTGFKAVSVNDVVVNVGKASSLALKLEPGQVSEVVQVTDAAGTDLSSTAVSQNLSNQLFENIPVARGVQDLFYLAPGTTDSLGGGRSNPSISGGSALDNLYVADGVNITDSAFGGMGTFSRSYGPLGTGINTSFIKEVQVKTAGFEPQYGQSQGGIVNIITQSGSNEYHGALYGFAQPKSFEATRKQPDDADGGRVNKFGKLLHEESYDVGADFGGYVPGARDHLFFYGSFNPTVRRQLFRGAEANAADPTNSGLRVIRGPEFAGRIRTLNYAGKLEYLINPNHQLTFSIFGDPSKTNKSSWRTLNIDNTTSDSVLDYGTRNISLRYNGTLTPTTTFNASLGLGRSTFDETGFDNLNLITDRRGADRLVIQTVTGQLPSRGTFNAVGLGFYEPTESRSKRLEFNLAKTHSMWGQHTLGLGYTFQRGNYDGLRERSGPKFTIPAGNGAATGAETNVQFRLRYRRPDQCRATEGGPVVNCALYPVALANGTTQLVPVRLQVFRAEFGQPSFETFSNYHAWYAQDTWRFNKYITGLFGLRWEQERLVGSPGPTGDRIGYSFTGQWAPRLGVTVDPLGRGKTKAYYNYGRFFEYIPLDLAERSLSVEQDWIGANFLPQFTTDASGNRVAVINQYGTVTPVIDAAHQLSAASVSLADPSNPISPGTKLGFTDEHTFGFEQQLPKNFTLSVRYIDRRAKRIVEDAASVSPEAAEAGIVQVYYIGNIGSTLDAAVNLRPFYYTTGAAIPSGCALDGGVPIYNFDGPNNRSVCFAQTGIDPETGAEINVPDGQPDGFPDAVRKYRAVEIELNRRFANGWQGFFNWRIAKLEGNFEGHLRNDNGQTDPAISSLFDFTAGEFGLLGDQFAIGPLNTDRRHIVNLYGSYAFDRDRGFRKLHGLNVGLNVHFETGLPVSSFNAHPVYLNAGEVPVGGRGSLGRTDNYIRFDTHLDYAIPMGGETRRLKLIADFFNLFNSQRVRRPDEFKALDVDPATLENPPNPDFLKPRSFYNPFSLRLGLRYEF